jgi:hypothetical protein
MLALIAGERVMNLAELSRAVAADPNLCRRLTQAACLEFGRSCLSVEQAVVLLGREGLAAHFLRLAHTRCKTAAANSRRPEHFALEHTQGGFE